MTKENKPFSKELNNIPFSIFVIGSFIFLNSHLFGQEIDLDNQGPAINTNFPDFNYKTIEGEYINSDQFKDKILVINVWFVGCKGCKQEEPFLKKITKQFENDDKIEFIGFCMSNPGRLSRYLEKNGDFGYKNISLGRKEVEENFLVVTSPTHFIIKDGVLVSKYTGPLTPYNESFQWFQNKLTSIRAKFK